MTNLETFNRSTGTEKTTAKYKAVNTAALCKTFTDAGYSIRKIQGNAEKGKHIIRLQHESMKLTTVDQVSPEIVIMNSFDGGSSFRIMLGVFRLVCSNGLVVGSMVDEIRIRHVGNNVEHQVFIAAEKMKENVFKLASFIETAKARILSDAEKTELAIKTMFDVLSTTDRDDKSSLKPAITAPTKLLRIRRPADTGSDAWSVLNRVQENALQGGLKFINQDTGNVVRLKSIRSADRNIKVNKAIWDNAAKYLAAA